MPAMRKSRRPALPQISFNHAMVYVRDVDRALGFYCDRLGFRLIEEYRHSGQAAYARLRAPRGTSTLALHLVERGQSLPQKEGIRLYFEVAHLERFCKSLADAGVKFSRMPRVMPWGWKHAYLHDPDGHEVSLYWSGNKRFKKSSMS